MQSSPNPFSNEPVVSANAPSANASPANAQQRALGELRAQNRQFPSLNRLVTGVALYGCYAAISALIGAFRTGKWIGVSGGVLVLVWAISLGFRLRQRVKWAWLFTLLASAFLVLRFVIGLLAQFALSAGAAKPTATLFYDPVKVGFYLVGLGLSAYLLFNTLQKSTRSFFFAPHSDAAS